jgi:protein SCO1
MTSNNAMNRRQAMRLGMGGGAALIAAGGAQASERKPRRPLNVIPNVEVFDQDGRPYRFHDDLVKNKVVMVNAFYAECGGACPLVTENLKVVYDMFDGRVGRDIHMYTFTLQPERDTPELLKQYAEVYGIGPGWKFLTGKPADMEEIRQALGFTDVDREIDILNDSHTGILRYGNDALKRWAACPAAGRPEGIYFSITSSVMDAGIGQPKVPAKLPQEPAHQHHHASSAT